MLGTYIEAKFAIPENPVMRANQGFAPLMVASEQKGITGLSAPRGGLGCGCSSKIPPFGLGNTNDEGLRLYGDWYGSQQTGGMRLNGDSNGLGTYFVAPGVRSTSTGMGDLENLMSNLTSGNFGAAMSGNDIASSMPNWMVILGGWWAISTFFGQVSRTKARVGARYRAARGAPRGKKFRAANEAA